MLTESRPVGRLAPSPTGSLHLGHARTFLLAFWQMRALGGRLLLRLEDLDGVRVTTPLIDQVLYDLEWLGLDWDGAPELQSRNVECIRTQADELERRGRAYACVCTRGALRRVINAPQAADQEPRYPGTCRGRFSSLAAAEISSPTRAGLRFVTSAGKTSIDDGFVGRMEFDVQDEVGDFLILRRDKLPSYQLAVVADDAASGVTHVLRGSDLLPSAARQSQLQEALGLPSVRWFHVPLVCDSSGRRLAKRADDLSLAELRERGVDARAIVAWAASSAGMLVPDRISAREALREFNLARVPRTNVVLCASTLAGLIEAR